MAIDITEFLDDSADDQFWRQFIKTADTPVTRTMNATRVASEIYLAKTLKATGTTIQSEIQDTADKLRKALVDHATALNESALAANKHARGLKWATWALVFATGGLIFATIFKSI